MRSLTRRNHAEEESTVAVEVVADGRTARRWPGWPGGTPTAQEDEPLLAHQWTGASALTTKVMTGLLWCLLLTGPLALVFHLVSAPVPPPVAQVDLTDELAAQRVAVSAFAEDMVVTWLTTPRGQEQNLERFVVDASSVTLAEAPWRVSGASTTSVEPTRVPGVWSVTVAVSVSEGRGKALRPVRRYFQVPVRYTDRGALRAQTLPAPVPGPAVADPDRLSYRYRAGLTDPVAAAAEDFLAALLAGTGDVARYVSPSSEISAIDPAPYTTVVIEEVMLAEEPAEDGTSPAAAEERHLLVTATVTAAAEQHVTVQYALTLAARDGRWEVKAIDPAPAGAAPQEPAPSTDPASTQTPAPSEPATPSTTN